MNKLSENQLLSLMKEGNQVAFNHIYTKYWKRLYFYTFKIFKDEQACEDIVQDVFVKLWLSDSKHEIQNIEAYLFGAVRYKVANSIRDVKWVTDHDEALQKIVGELSAEAPLEFKEIKTQIEGSIQSLPEKCREVFRLYHHDGLSVGEIASNLNISIRTVETHIYNARQLLRRTLPNSVAFLLLLAIPIS